MPEMFQYYLKIMTKNMSFISDENHAVLGCIGSYFEWYTVRLSKTFQIQPLETYRPLNKHQPAVTQVLVLAENLTSTKDNLMCLK